LRPSIELVFYAAEEFGFGCVVDSTTGGVMRLDTILSQFTTKYITIYGITCRPGAGMVLPLYLYFVFARAERKNEIQ
jgi:hypothetical protein